MTQNDYQAKRDGIEDNIARELPHTATAGALLLIADLLYEMIDQNRGVGVFRECLLRAVAGVQLDVRA